MILRDVLLDEGVISWIGGWLSRYGLAGRVFELVTSDPITEGRVNTGMIPIDLVFVAGEFSAWYSRIWDSRLATGTLVIRSLPGAGAVKRSLMGDSPVDAKATWYSGTPHLVITSKNDIRLRHANGDLVTGFTMDNLADVVAIRTGKGEVSRPGLGIAIMYRKGRLGLSDETVRRMFHEYVHVAQKGPKGHGTTQHTGSHKGWDSRFSEIEAVLGQIYMDSLREIARRASSGLTVEACARRMGWTENEKRFFRNVSRSLSRHDRMPLIDTEFVFDLDWDNEAHRRLVLSLHSGIAALIKPKG